VFESSSLKGTQLIRCITHQPPPPSINSVILNTNHPQNPLASFSHFHNIFLHKQPCAKFFHGLYVKEMHVHITEQNVLPTVSVSHCAINEIFSEKNAHSSLYISVHIYNVLQIITIHIYYK
jgi:hypothetical protein